MSRSRLVGATGLMASALYLALALATLDLVAAGDADRRFFSNLGGTLGTAAARALVEPFGAGAFGVPFFLVFLGSTLLGGRRIGEPIMKLLGLLVFMITAGMVLESLLPDRFYPRTGAPLGGMLGEIASRQLERLFGSLGAALSAVILFLLASLLTTERLIPRVLAALAGGTGAAGTEIVRRGGRSRRKTGAGDLVLPEGDAAGPSPRRTKKSASAAPASLLPAMDTDPDPGLEAEAAPVDLSPPPGADDGDAADPAAAPPDPPAELEHPEPPIRSGIRAAESFENLELNRRDGDARSPYELPPPALLAEETVPDSAEKESSIREKAQILEQALASFGIEARVVEIQRGPVITMYELALAAGTKVKTITSLGDDIAMVLRATTVRIVAPLPGKSTVGVEVPNQVRETVFLRELLRSEALRSRRLEIPLLLGKDAAGGPLIEDMAGMPHLLIAGSTGSGKSVCLNSIIMSILLLRHPEDVRLILIDPKMVELQLFKDIPHLLTPVVTDMKKAPKILEWAVAQMEERYELLAAARVRNIGGFNRLEPDEIRSRLRDTLTDDEVAKAPVRLPFIVIVVDELADLMMMSAKEVEMSICRLAQKSRAVGIHIILATQRPSVDVITGLIKANMPARISFKVSSRIDSRTILDRSGSDKLLGHGDMLFLPPRSSVLIRAQGTLVADREIKSVTDYLLESAGPPAPRELVQGSDAAAAEGDDDVPVERDDIYRRAVEIVLSSQRGSVSMLQRKLAIGYTRAARLIDLMAEDGVVGAYKGSKAREVVMTLDAWRQGGPRKAGPTPPAAAGDGAAVSTDTGERTLATTHEE